MEQERVNWTLDNVWEQVEPFFSEVLAHDTKRPRDKIEFMEIYSTIYKFICFNDVPQSYMYSFEEGLYYRLMDHARAFCIDTLRNGLSKSGEALLNYYNVSFEKYSFSSKVIANRAAFLEQNFIPCRESKLTTNEKPPGVHKLRTAFFLVWKATFLEMFKDKVVAECLDVIQRDRDGEKISINLLRGLTKCFVDLGSENTANPKQLYQDHFETAFLVATSEYYQAEFDSCLASSSMAEYMSKAESRLTEERDRVANYLEACTEQPLISMCVDLMLTRNIDKITAQFPRYLADVQIEHLGRMFRLTQRVSSEHTSGLSDALKEHIIPYGKDKVAGLGSSADGASYIATLVQCLTHFRKIVRDAFEDDVRFLTNMDKACKEFVNRNSVTEASATKSARTPELLAKSFDTHLKSSKESQEELERKFDDLIGVFRYLEDNDVFQRFYKKALAKRLIMGSSISEDIEAMVISKLKQICGVEWTRHLEKMYKDMATSKELANKFKSSNFSKAVSHDSIKSFNALVLCKGSWPLRLGHSITLPKDLAFHCETFASYYASRHNERVLTWVLDHSRGELKTNFTKDKKGNHVPYILSSSAHQMAVLLLFNCGSPLSLDNIVERLDGMDDKEYISNVISLLLKTKLIYEEDGMYKVQLKWRHKKVKLNINYPVKVGEDKVTAQVHNSIQEERRFVIQACIVRCMKTRNVMKHKDLILETIEQLKSRFQVISKDVNRQIGQLIEKEFIRRQEGHQDVYEYIA
eukprot:m.42721 g.42721  ORF g.42721 m.42721 type:complete len:751 (-) comp9904_c0_seq1:48-2300(-)